MRIFKNNCKTVLDVIIEGKDNDGNAIGTSGNYIKVSMPFDNADQGKPCICKDFKSFRKSPRGIYYSVSITFGYYG